MDPPTTPIGESPTASPTRTPSTMPHLCLNILISKGATDILEVAKVTAAEPSNSIHSPEATLHGGAEDASDEAQERALDPLLKDIEKEDQLSNTKASPKLKRKRVKESSTSPGLNSASDNGESPAKRKETTAGERLKVTGRGAKLLHRTLNRESGFNQLKSTKLSQTSGSQIPQKVSIGAGCATPWDPFATRKLVEDTKKVGNRVDNELAEGTKKPESLKSRFVTWKEEGKDGEPDVTWKVFPKSTPRINHRGGTIVVANLLEDPLLHPDIEIKEYEADQKCWIARVEHVSLEAVSARRIELTERAKKERKEQAKQAKRRGNGYTKRSSRLYKRNRETDDEDDNEHLEENEYESEEQGDDEDVQTMASAKVTGKQIQVW